MSAAIESDDSVDVSDHWVDVCSVEDIAMDRGVCALVADRAIAVFRASPDGTLFALSNLDPFSGASVMSRGIVGSCREIRKIASPMYKQSFDLATGICLDDPDVRLDAFAVRDVDGRIQIGPPIVPAVDRTP